MSDVICIAVPEALVAVNIWLLADDGCQRGRCGLDKMLTAGADEVAAIAAHFGMHGQTLSGTSVRGRRRSMSGSCRPWPQVASRGRRGRQRPPLQSAPITECAQFRAVKASVGGQWCQWGPGTGATAAWRDFCWVRGRRSGAAGMAVVPAAVTGS